MLGAQIFVAKLSRLVLSVFEQLARRVADRRLGTVLQLGKPLDFGRDRPDCLLKVDACFEHDLWSDAVSLVQQRLQDHLGFELRKSQLVGLALSLEDRLLGLFGESLICCHGLSLPLRAILVSQSSFGKTSVAG